MLVSCTALFFISQHGADCAVAIFFSPNTSFLMTPGSQQHHLSQPLSPSVEALVGSAFFSACALLNAVIYQGRIIMPLDKGEMVFSMTDNGSVTFYV
jgi:hypothetical protein